MTPLELQRCHSERWRQPRRKWKFGVWPISSTISVRFARYRANQSTTVGTVSGVAPRLEAALGDITAESTDAIVNAANSALEPGGGVCGAIFARRRPGSRRGLRRGRRLPHRRRPRHARASRSPPASIIHAVGPVWHGGDARRARAPRLGLPPVARGGRRDRRSVGGLPGDLHRDLRLPARPATAIAVATVRSTPTRRSSSCASCASTPQPSRPTKRELAQRCRNGELSSRGGWRGAARGSRRARSRRACRAW